MLRRMGSERELIVKISANQMRSVGHVTTRRKTEELSLT